MGGRARGSIRSLEQESSQRLIPDLFYCSFFFFFLGHMNIIQYSKLFPLTTNFSSNDCFKLYSSKSSVNIHTSLQIILNPISYITTIILDFSQFLGSCGISISQNCLLFASLETYLMISHEYLEPAPYKNVRIPVVVMVLVLGMSRTLNSLNFFINVLLKDCPDSQQPGFLSVPRNKT